MKTGEQCATVFPFSCSSDSGNSSFSHQRLCTRCSFYPHKVSTSVYAVNMFAVQTMNEKLWGQEKGITAGRRQCSSNCQSVPIYHLLKSSKQASQQPYWFDTRATTLQGESYSRTRYTVYLPTTGDELSVTCKKGKCRNTGDLFVHQEMGSNWIISTIPKAVVRKKNVAL